MELGLSLEEFTRCIEQIVQISNTVLDGWKLEIKEGLDNGKYIAKKSTTSMENNTGIKTIVTFEYHIAYNISYGVPVLCFNVWKQDGSLFSLEEYWSNNENLKTSNMYDTLTQMDHPVLCRPFLTLHPCKTQEIMQPFLEKSKNPVISWLSVVGPFVHLQLLPDYVKCC